MEYLIGGLVGFSIGAAFQRLVFGLALWRWVSRKNRREMRDIYKMPDGLKWPGSPQRRNYGAPDPPYTLPVPPKPPTPPKHSKKEQKLMLETLKNRDFGSKINQRLDFDTKSRRFFTYMTGDPKKPLGWDMAARQVELKELPGGDKDMPF